jgi:hypothetical protein
MSDGRGRRAKRIASKGRRTGRCVAESQQTETSQWRSLRCSAGAFTWQLRHGEIAAQGRHCTQCFVEARAVTFTLSARRSRCTRVFERVHKDTLRHQNDWLCAESGSLGWLHLRHGTDASVTLKCSCSAYINTGPALLPRRKLPLLHLISDIVHWFPRRAIARPARREISPTQTRDLRPGHPAYKQPRSLLAHLLHLHDTTCDHQVNLSILHQRYSITKPHTYRYQHVRLQAHRTCCACLHRRRLRRT